MKKTPIVNSYHLAGFRRCLGWCDKEFYSKDKTRFTYCETCLAKKEKLQREGRPKGRMSESSFGDN